MSVRSLVNPRPFGKIKQKFLVYIPFDPLPSLLGAAVKNIALASQSGSSKIISTLPGGVILSQVVGAPAAVLWLERLIASGVKKILLLSFCGSLQPGLRIGDAVIPTKAISEEGTSPHYFPRKKVFRPSPALTEEVEQTLRQHLRSFSKAAVVTTDAPYRETTTWLRQMRSRRIHAVDMEASAVFALAEYRRVEATALMLVSDELFSGVWNNHFPPPLLRERIRHYFFPLLDRLKTKAQHR